MNSVIRRTGILSLVFLELIITVTMIRYRIPILVISLIPFTACALSFIKCNSTEREDGTKTVPIEFDPPAADTTDNTGYIEKSDAAENTGATPDTSDLFTVQNIEETVQVYKTAVPELFKSIVVYLNNTSEPMSETLLNLKTGITDFLSSIHTTRKDFESTSKLDEIQNYVTVMRKRITEVTNENNRSCQHFSSELETLSVQMKSITGFLSSISDIAARVHVLSINASIESARAGEQGRGFKVIANEIQKLANETQTFVTTISDTLEKTNAVFEMLKNSMNETKNIIARQTAEDSSTYEEISHLLSNHLEEIRDIYQKIIEYVETVDIDITTLSPITMLHAIITQEIENLEKLCGDFTTLVQDSCTGNNLETIPTDSFAAVEKVRSRLTTARELSALENALVKLGLSETVSVRKTETNIEFF